MNEETYKKLKYDYKLGLQEIEVLKQLIYGHSVEHIAVSRCRSYHTVQSQVRQLMRKLNVKNKYHLCIKGIQLGLVNINEIVILNHERI